MSKEMEFDGEMNVVEVDGIYYKINGDGTASVCKQEDNDFDKLVRIANEIRDGEGRVCKVTKIEENAFSSRDVFEAVEIPDGIIEIGEWAFSGCDNLKTVKLPNYIKELKKAIFYDCKSLQSIVIPDCVASIGDSAFYGCEALSDLILPESLTQIGSSAFDYCSSLKSMYISKYVTHISDHAFDHCWALEQIEVDPDNSLYFGDGKRLIEKHTNKVLYKCKNKNKTKSNTKKSQRQKETFMGGKEVKDMLIKDGFNYFLGYDYTAAIVENYYGDKMPKR
ncbi:MAG: leucine-rich repeat domain-containing protein, partial [Clostridia bacterium]|nr:leucine-rich repeat domain-containing protein [Clostridia bacterium]